MSTPRGWHHSFYYAVRTELLFWALVFTVLWGVFGFDSTLSSVGQMFNEYVRLDVINRVPQYGMGFHFSSIQNIILVCYALFLNISMGGLSLKSFAREVKKDLLVIPKSFSRKTNKNEASNYPDIPLLKCIYLLFFSILVTVFSFAIFETLWVHAYNFFQFGDLNWPLYYFAPGFPNWLMFRNYGSIAAGFVLSLLMLYYLRRYYGERFRFRFGTHLLSLSMLTVSLWLFWIMSPAPLMGQPVTTFNRFFDSEYGIRNCDGCILLNRTDGFLMPKQINFKQTSYTVYLQEDYMQAYSSKIVLGFFDNQPFTHFINIATKYVMSFTLAYPFMVRRIP